ncbi:MAG: 50S ribosomal protein L11 [Coprobacillaceae bacterium]
MSKKVARIMKIQFPAGGAKPGPALAGAGIQMPKFCTAFNDQTRDRMGETVPVVLTVYEDKDFDFVLKTAPCSEMIKKACGIKKGASNPGSEDVATLSADKLKEIAEYKMPDLNANDIDAAMKIIAGTARNMGVKVEGLDA